MKERKKRAQQQCVEEEEEVEKAASLDQSAPVDSRAWRCISVRALIYYAHISRAGLFLTVARVASELIARRGFTRHQTVAPVFSICFLILFFDLNQNYRDIITEDPFRSPSAAYIFLCVCAYG